jgi:hypothetical protein
MVGRRESWCVYPVDIVRRIVYNVDMTTNSTTVPTAADVEELRCAWQSAHGKRRDDLMAEFLRAAVAHRKGQPINLPTFSELARDAGV